MTPRDVRRLHRRAERRRRLWALALVAPLFLFLLVFFALPIGRMLLMSVENDELREVLPRTAALVREWDGTGLPGETVFAALAGEMRAARADRTLPQAAKRLDYDVAGLRRLMLRTAARLPESPDRGWRETLIGLDDRWGETAVWAAIRRAAAPVTGLYLLNTVDLRFDAAGAIVPVAEREAVYLDVFARTFWIAGVVTAACLVLGYPLAYKLATLPARIGNLLIILVLLPFWTSLLVRTMAWIVILQRNGPANDLLLWLGAIEEPLRLAFARPGVYAAMTHILLPFMVLPLYSVMRGISPWHMRAAESLGAPPWRAFLSVYLPQTLPGIGAGCLLVFILAIGYYITPALIGGAGDQMVGYFVAFFTNRTINWGMAAALGSVLLVLVTLLYAIYARLVGVDRMRLG